MQQITKKILKFYNRKKNNFKLFVVFVTKLKAKKPQ